MAAKKSKKKMWTILAIIAVFLLVQWSFIGYRYNFCPFRALGDIRMSKLPGNAESYGMDQLSAMENSPLKDSQILFLGSSVTYGAASLREGIPEYFAVRLDARVTKEAVSGTTLTDDSNSSYVHRLLTEVDPSTDYRLVVCQLSTNDASKNKPLGVISESRNMEDFDTKTVTGAMEYIIAYCRETWNCPVVFYTNARYDSEAYALLVERLLALREKWGIGVLDLWDSETFNAISEADRQLYMYDSIHPTKAGYREWWCPEMERQMLEYLAGIE